jgi:hypothetical protein
MKKAKIMLAVIAVLAIGGGGTLAFRARTGTRTFYAYGFRIIAGQLVTGCVVPYTLPLSASLSGSLFPYYTTTFTNPDYLGIVPDYPCFTYTVTTQ